MTPPRLVARLGLVAGAALVVTAVVGCDNGSTDKLTVYQDAPRMTPVDVGPPGTSPGDAYYFSAELHARPGGPVVGEVFGSKTLVKPGASQNPATEQRVTMLVFTFNGRKDQLMVAGVPDYPANAPEFAPDVPVLRAVVGGTGKYAAARGELTSVRNPDGTYTQRFSLKT